MSKQFMSKKIGMDYTYTKINLIQSYFKMQLKITRLVNFICPIDKDYNTL